MENLDTKRERLGLLHEWLCCDLGKSDIPAVQRRVFAITSALEDQFDENEDDALDALLLLLLAADLPITSLREREAFATRVTGEVARAMRRMPRRLHAVAGTAGRQLLKEGALFIGRPLPNTPTVRALADRAADDLEFWFSRSFVGAGRGAFDDLRRWVLEFLTKPEHRTAAGRLLWVERARDLIERGRTSLRLAADLWGYRWFNIGLFETHDAEAGRTGRPLVLVAVNNPPWGPDARTTPFCRWVHDRPVSIQRVRDQISAYFEAQDKGDPKAAKAAWPLLSGKDALGDGAAFETLFEELGLPPYHMRCRTIVLSRVG